MKKLIALGLILLGAEHSQAQILNNSFIPVSGTVEKVMNIHNEKMVVELNNDTVLCSGKDYSMTLLKVNIPQLADITLLNHRNNGAGGPCMFTPGQCSLKSKKLLTDAQNPTEEIVVTVTQTRGTQIDNEKGICNVWLREDLSTNIRGLPFLHTKYTQLPVRDAADCKTEVASQTP